MNADILAPTNVALKRLRSKLKSDTIKDERFATIHRTIYGAPDKDTGKFKVSRSLNKPCYIIDEASMIDQKMLDDIMTLAKQSNSKIVFMGDGFQLPAVGKDPELFANIKLKEIFALYWRSSLKEVRRTDGEILNVATHIRTSEKAEIITTKGDEFKVVAKFSPELLQDIKKDNDYMVITTTNQSRMAYNKKIRQVKFGDEALLHDVLNGEKLISVSNQMYANGESFVAWNPQILRSFEESINLGTLKDPKFVKLIMHLILHSTSEYGEGIKTLVITNLEGPSMYPYPLMQNPYISSYDQLTVRHDRWGKMWNPAVNIATYGYAMSANKAQGSEWDNVYINCDWMMPSSKERWLYTAVTRAKKKVELKKSKYFKTL
jgi:ATP-dependent exoDNAse (exonuclease V) alpha subunit